MCLVDNQGVVFLDLMRLTNVRTTLHIVAASFWPVGTPSSDMASASATVNTQPESALTFCEGQRTIASRKRAAPTKEGSYVCNDTSIRGCD